MTCLSSQLVDKEFHADKQKQICFSPSIVTEMVMTLFIQICTFEKKTENGAITC